MIAYYRQPLATILPFGPLEGVERPTVDDIRAWWEEAPPTVEVPCEGESPEPRSNEEATP